MTGNDYGVAEVDECGEGIVSNDLQIRDVSLQVL